MNVKNTIESLSIYGAVMIVGISAVYAFSYKMDEAEKNYQEGLEVVLQMVDESEAKYQKAVADCDHTVENLKMQLIEADLLKMDLQAKLKKAEEPWYSWIHDGAPVDEVLQMKEKTIGAWETTKTVVSGWYTSAKDKLHAWTSEEQLEMNAHVTEYGVHRDRERMYSPVTTENFLFNIQ